MNRINALKKYALLGGVLFVLPLLGLILFGVLGDHAFNTLPYYTSEGAVEGRAPGVQRVGDFRLMNQNGESFTSDSLKGKVWLAAFFATDAPHVASVTKQLLWPNFRYRAEEDIVTVCFTLKPDLDRPERLKSYVERNTRYNEAAGKWQFLTGDAAVIDRLVAEDFMIQRDPEDPYNVATIWLVDAEGYLRGVYHAASEDDIRDAVEDIALLQKELDEAAYARRKSREAAGTAEPLPVFGPEGHVVPPFSFTNLDGREFSHRNVGNRVRVVDYFFTHCPTICPVMSSQLVRLQAQMRKDGITHDDVLLLSHTVDPRRDTPERLLEYATRIGADTSQWKFLTGSEEDLYDMARTGYYLKALPSDTAAGGFFHSDTFTLVDEHGLIRGYYDGTSTEEVDQLLSHLKQLLAEASAHAD